MSFESRNPATSDTHREEGMKDQKKIRLGLIGGRADLNFHTLNCPES